MDARTRLESNLVAEAEAYGYTLSVWGAGALLVHAFGVPGVTQALAYVAGAVAGFGALALAAFPGVAATAAVEESPSSRVVSMLHLVATGGTLGAVHLLVRAAAGLRPVVVFFLAGAVATVAYNLLLLFEELAPDALR